ncbi:rhamnulokinase [Jatrophihabitans telluris]|uniref:Rhamnulokinase n=1 Tax=Jatrophihabitans telluris TaxID=2038343 RepID=A0ABY4QVX7_9ACTN|nr:rhamnulokinase family protein [Jatrophihabitans telluris]UQX87434.1 rhamnulokinase [Jatrophihabitans telluris]
MSPPPAHCVAIDLGASSGRVLSATVSADALTLVELHRYPNLPVRVAGSLEWDVLYLYREALEGLRRARQVHGPVDSIGVDSWAVDYGLIAEDGRLIGNPVHYRDLRTAGAADAVFERLPRQILYERTGIQHLPFNTVFQLAASLDAPAMQIARELLLVPDLFNYWLTGVRTAEYTNATTTGLVDAHTRTWSPEILATLAGVARLLPEIVDPGTVLGALRPEVQESTGLDASSRVVCVGSHDTASAVVGVPAEGEGFAYISCGTWSLVGLELTRPVLTDASRRANFSNEGGVDATTRFLRNVMGLWLLQESVRSWQAAGQTVDLAALIGSAATQPGHRSLIDPDDIRFLPPGDMPSRIREYCAETGQPQPATQAAVVRCILDSLALAYRRTVRQAAELSGTDVSVVHVVGGGARNGLLCQLAADATGLPVLAGPVEAAAIGNALVQARAIGAINGHLSDLRRISSTAEPVTRFRPSGQERDWAAAEARIYG